MSQKIKVTYTTMTADNEELQLNYDQAILTVKSNWLGQEVPMFINGSKVYTKEKFKDYSPIDTNTLICSAQSGTQEHAKAAIKAAKSVFKDWRATSWRMRVALLRKIAENIRDNSLELSALIVMEVGKNRLEALGEVEESADLLDYYANSMEKNNGFINELGKSNPNDHNEKNISVLRPYGVWIIISPFNFPMALSVAPIAAALVTGNTVVFKGSSDTAYTGWKASELFANADLPPGVFNYVSGPGRTVGKELLENPDVAGWTFTGSYDVGMKVFKQAAQGIHPRPAIIEMGGKNPTIISNKADIGKAARGVMRSAFGLNGQKCSACSRVYVQEGVYDAFKTTLLELTKKIKISDPTERDTYMGTMINRTAYNDYQMYVEIARSKGKILYGGRILDNGAYAKGYFVEPTIIEGLPEENELVRKELFLPILHMAKVKTLEEAMQKANDTPYGLTAGFYSKDEGEIEWFFEKIEAGTVYANWTVGATTGAWPGVQAFGGWKGSGSSGKGIGGLYTLALYMHEHSRTAIFPGE